MKKIWAPLILLFVFFGAVIFFAEPAHAQRRPRALAVEGVPAAVLSQLKARFPQAFESGATLADVDQMVRYLMSTKTFANVEVVERSSPDGTRLVLMASLIRRISDIEIQGQRQLSRADVMQILGIEKGRLFERKDLVAAADQLQEVYGKMGHLNAKIEIDFSLPNETDVRVSVRIDEGTPCIVTDMTFETSNKELSRRALRFANSVLNRPMSEENIMNFQKELNEYFSQNRFLTAKLSPPSIVYNADRTQARLTYLIESPYRYEFLFEGNTFFEPGSILRQIEPENLYGLTTSPAADMADRIRKLYQATGFPDIEVSYRERVFDQTHRYQINFSLQEGKRVRIRRLEVAGNISRPAGYYRDFIRDHSSDLIRRGYYNRVDLESAYGNLKVELQNQGFLRSRIQSVRTEYDKSRSQVSVFINLDEGPLTQVRQIKFEGVTHFSRLQLAQLMNLEPGSPLSLNELGSSLNRLKDFYRQNGFLEMRIENERSNEGLTALVQYNDSNTQADINVVVNEGPQVKVESIVIEGNTLTKSHVILRELAFSVGDVLTPEKIEDSVVRLQRMNLFSRVDIRSPDAGTKKSDRTLVVSVIDRDPGLFTSGIGITNERAVEQTGVTGRGYLGINYRNLGGKARSISGRVGVEYSTDPDISYLENEIVLGYLEPYMFGGRNRGRVSISRRQDYYGKERRVRNGTEDLVVVMQERNQVSFLLERDLTRNLKWIQTIYSFANQSKFERKEGDTLETQNIAKVGPLFEYDTRDSVFLPRRGFVANIGYEYSDPWIGSSKDSTQMIRFNKVSSGITTYWKILRNYGIILENTLRGGYVANLSTQANGGVPPTETFFLGGRTTLRGYAGGEVERTPNKYQLGVDEIRLFRLTGDSSFYLFKTDLRLPIWGELADFVLFYDGGAVYINQPGVQITDPYRDTAGAGLRFNTPVGPFKIEMGFKLDRKTFSGERESEKALHISFGNF